jgi:phosphoribosylanthranilate isomerase
MHGEHVTRTRVKICGITRPEDALDATECGADAIGLVFYEKSPRAVDAERARSICNALPPFVTTVGLFVDAEAAEVQMLLRDVPLDLLQFHGAESEAYCRQFQRPYIKALRMNEEIDLQQLTLAYSSARALLLDAYQPGVPGGTGHGFDWGRIPMALRSSIILAGGLSPDNAEQAVREVRPYALDVSSGVEREKGIKDAEKIAAFMRGVRRGDAD